MEQKVGPHQRSIGKRLAKRKLTCIRSAGDHDSTGPTAVFAQSCARISSPISPPAVRKVRSSLRVRRCVMLRFANRPVRDADGLASVFDQAEAMAEGIAAESHGTVP